MSDPAISVLLIEDNPGDARLIDEMLCESKTARFRLVPAKRLAAAIELLAREEIDVVLLDLFLPDSRGLATFREVRAHAPALPIVVLTGLSDESLAARALREGAQDYLPKGRVDSELLVRSMRYAIERQRAEGALREHAERLRKLSHVVEQSPGTVMILDLEGRVEYVNRRFTQLTGYGAEEVRGAFAAALAGLPSSEAAEIFGAVAAGGEWKGELQHARKDGKPFYEFASISAVRGEDGRISHLVKLGTDLTERRLLEEQLRQAQKMEAVGRLAGGVAHDFNNLLMVIIGYGDFVLSRLGPGEPLRREVEEISKAADRAAALTRQLLTFSRPQVLQPRPLDLSAIVKDLDGMLRRLIGENIELVAELCPTLKSIRADPGEMEQVVMNLAINARDAMPEGGRLIIRTANVELDAAYARVHVGVRRGSYVQLTVTDTGQGMDERTQARIFEPFFTTKDQNKGTGLGLSTVYGIVRRAEGEILVHSEPDKGTTFTVNLPSADESTRRVKTASRDLALLRGSETILLAEDEETVRDLVRKVLQASGYTVLESDGPVGAEAMCRSHEGPIHLLVTDVVMPGVSGRGLAERLSVLRPGLKVLFMSGYTDDTQVYRIVKESGAAFLQKPFTPEALVLKVREMLAAGGRRKARARMGPAEAI